MLILPRRFGYRQPLQLAPINRGNPITNQLCFAALPSGASFVDVLTGATGTPTGAGLPTNAIAAGGRNMLFNGGAAGNSYINFGTADLNASDIGLVGGIGGGATWFFWAAPTGQGGLAERNDNNSVNAGWMVGINSSSKIKFLMEHGTTNTVGISTGAVTLSVYTSLAVSWFSTSAGSITWNFYIGGADVGGTTVAVGVGTSGSDAAQSLYLGRNTFAGLGDSSVGSCAGNIEFAAFWKRVLSAAEIASLHANRYQIFKAGPRRLFDAATAARPQVFAYT